MVCQLIFISWIHRSLQILGPSQNSRFSLKYWRKLLTQLYSFLNLHGLHEVFQSGFKSLHSTETALLKVFNDLLLVTDSGDYAVLMLLDLTAAFDTVDHNILIFRMEHCVGIKDTVLEWFRSYLSGRSFSIRLGDFMSSSACFSCGIPQGFILGPILFSLYILPLGSIFRKYNVLFHCYADDTQLYLPLKQKHPNSIAPLLCCLEEIKAWMAVKF